MNHIAPIRCRDALLDREYDREYCSGAFSDELDQLGLRAQVAAGWTQNRPSLRCFGRARTLRLETVETQDERIAWGLGFLEQLEPGDILVIEGSMEFAYFGEMMTRLALRGGLAGVVIEGLTRDSFFTQTADLPIFSRGYTPVDIKGRGRVASVDEPVSVGSVCCRSGDYLFADHDAVVILPHADLPEILRRVHRAARHERSLKKWIDEGLSVQGILERTSGF